MDAMKTTFLRHFDELDRAVPAPAMQPLRQAGRAKFRELPFPSPRMEDWRFTNVTALTATPFELARDSTAVEVNRLPKLPSPDALRLTFVNGWFAPSLSILRETPSGLAVGRLAEASSAHLTRIGQLADYRDNVFTALNSGAIGDGAYVLIKDAAVIERPIEILYVTRASGRPIVSYPRTLIVAGRGSQASILERYLALDDAAYFTNAVSEIAVAESAVIDHCKLQQEGRQAYHVANTQAALARSAQFRTHSVMLGGRLVRNEVRVRFDDEGGEATVNGLYLGDGQRHLDNFTVIDHARPHCASHELYKGILADQAHGVFNGKIFVRPGAQKTDAKQTNKVLLLSDNATINTKPQLEIFADDVKCTHGATIGQLDADQLFYLRARGVPHEQARRLLTFAFANDIVSRIALPAIREELEEMIVRRG
jgi:Fe-S cluster assembly protein SufD